MQQFDVTLFFKRFLFYMTAEVSVLLIPAVPVCQSIESPQCIFSLALLPSISYPDTPKVTHNPKNTTIYILMNALNKVYNSWWNWYILIFLNYFIVSYLRLGLKKSLLRKLCSVCSELLLSGIRRRIELQTTILQLAHPSFWQQINKRSKRGQLYKSWVAFPPMTNYQLSKLLL